MLIDLQNVLCQRDGLTLSHLRLSFRYQEVTRCSRRAGHKLLFVAVCGQSETRDVILTDEGTTRERLGQTLCHAISKLDESCISILACAHLGQSNHRRHVGEAVLVKRQKMAPSMLDYRTARTAQA